MTVGPVGAGRGKGVPGGGRGFRRKEMIKSEPPLGMMAMSREGCVEKNHQS